MSLRATSVHQWHQVHQEIDRTEGKAPIKKSPVAINRQLKYIELSTKKKSKLLINYQPQEHRAVDIPLFNRYVQLGQCCFVDLFTNRVFDGIL